MQGYNMTQLYLVNYEAMTDDFQWLCDRATISYTEAKEAAENLRLFGFNVRIQSVSITDKGYIANTPWRWEPKQKENV